MSEQTEKDAALAWVVSGDTGMSSQAIWAHMMGVTPTRGGRARRQFTVTADGRHRDSG